MRNIMNRFTSLLALGVFVFSMILLPGLAVQSFAQDTAAPQAAATGTPPAGGKEPSKDMAEFTERVLATAQASGGEGGAAAASKLSTGTIITGALVVATGVTIAIMASDDGGSSTSRH